MPNKRCTPHPSLKTIAKRTTREVLRALPPGGETTLFALVDRATRVAERLGYNEPYRHFDEFQEHMPTWAIELIAEPDELGIIHIRAPRQKGSTQWQKHKSRVGIT